MNIPVFSGSIKPIERPFTPDTGKDLGNIWKRQSQVTPARRLAKPNALMFFHIPLYAFLHSPSLSVVFMPRCLFSCRQESYSPADVDPDTNARLDKGLHGSEAPGAASKSDGFFAKGLLKAMESEHVAGGNATEVKVVANGHCHLTENCRRVKGVWLCFGGGGYVISSVLLYEVIDDVGRSYSGYGRVG
jgi:hypothetical protein